MITSLWGKKIGMTQIFSEQGVVPVTAIDVAQWIVTRIKTKDRDGYDAIQIGRLKDRYAQDAFSADWIKKPGYYFSFIKEVSVSQPVSDKEVGAAADLHTILAAGDRVDVSGKTKGRGFAGVVRRHNFNGPPATHGSTMGKRTGSLSFMRSRGRVIKGKRMPGHYGNEQHMVKNLEIIRIEPTAKVVLVKGAIPGKSGSLVCLRKA